MIFARTTKHSLMMLLVAVALSPSKAMALDQSDAMSKWAESSEQDRLHVLDELRARDSKIRQADRASVLACMDAAAAVPGHRDLRIGEIAAACSEPPPPASREPQTEI